MKNLKKVLSFSLAVIMVLGMMIIPASAATTSGYASLLDKDDITNKDAVALLVDLGIVEGVSTANGNIYNPTGLVDRATMAKFATLLVYKNAVAANFTGTVTDLTDIDGTWAEGFIKYCYTQNIIAGDGQGNFNPTSNVTVAEAAKMLLVAAGYNAETEGLVGADWAINTIALATNAGLLNGISISGSTVLDRDNGAKLISNALFMKQAGYLSINISSTAYYNRLNSVGLATYGLVAITGELQSANNDSLSILITETNPTYDGTATNSALNAALVGTTRSFDLGGQQQYIGKNVTIYVSYPTTTITNNLISSVQALVNRTATIISTELVINEDSALGTSHDGTSYSDLTTSSKSAFIAREDDVVTFYLNGNYVGASNVTTTDEVNAISAVKDLIKRAGVVTTFVDSDNDSKVDTVMVTAYTYAKVTAKTSTSITFSPGFGEYEYSSSAFSISSRTTRWDADDVSIFDSLSVDDYVYGYVADGNLYVNKYASKVEGTVTAYPNDGKKVSIDGTSYTLSKAVTNGILGDTTLTDDSVGSELSVYTDANGYVFAIDEIEAATLGYLYIKKTDEATATLTGRLAANVYFADGTSATVSVISVNGYKEDDAISVANSTNAYYYGSTSVMKLKTAVRDAAVYKYTIDSNGYYKLSTVDNMEASFTAGSFTNAKSPFTATMTAIPNNGATTGAAGTGFTANSSTVVVNTDTGKVYTGYNNIPTLSGATGTVMLNSTSNYSGSAKIIFLTDASVSGDTSNRVVVYDTATYTRINGNEVYYSVNGFVDGVKETVYLTSSAYNTISTLGTTVIFNVKGVTTIDSRENVIDTVENEVKLVDASGRVIAGSLVTNGDFTYANGVERVDSITNKTLITQSGLNGTGHTYDLTSSTNYVVVKYYNLSQATEDRRDAAGLATGVAETDATIATAIEALGYNNTSASAGVSKGVTEDVAWSEINSNSYVHVVTSDNSDEAVTVYIFRAVSKS